MNYINIDADKMARELMQNQFTKHGEYGCVPKPFGAPSFYKPFQSFNDVPDKLVQWNDIKDAIAFFIDQQTFPQFHQIRSWINKLQGNWYQNGLNWCWAWSLTALMADIIARQNGTDNAIVLAPAGFGPAVNWANKGNYLEAGLQHATSYGTPTVEYAPENTWHSRSPRSWKDGWEENAMLHRIDPETVYKMDTSTDKSMIQHCLTVLKQGDPIYIAYYWWGHALELVGMEWDESVKNNIAWIIRNSHNEKEFLRLTGDRAVPDEGFSVGAMRVPI